MNVARLTINSLLQAVAQLDGIRFLGMTLTLEAIECEGGIFSSGREERDPATLAAVVDRLLANQSINLPWLPDAVERRLYTNVLRVFLTVLDDCVSALSLNLIGHELVLDFRAQRSAAWLESRPQAVDQAVVHRLTDAVLADRAANIAWLPDEVERQIYHNTFRLVIGLLQEIFGSTSLRCGGQLISLHLQPSALSASESAPEAEAAIAAAASTQQPKAYLANLTRLRRAEREAVVAHAAELAELRDRKEAVKRQARAQGVRV